MANEEYLAILKQGVGAWNKWQRDNEDKRPDFDDANLRGANLRGLNFSRVDLRGASLCEADLSNSDLNEAHLCGAD